MSRVIRIWLAAMVLSGAASAAAAQTRTVGLVVGYPAAAGVIWHVTDGIAIRPDVAFSRQRTETTSTVSLGFPGGTQSVTTTSTGWTSSVGASALFYLGAPDALRFYVSPRFAYVWSRSDSESEPESLVPIGAYEQKSDGYLVAGSVGAQYAPHDRFRLFGELGLSYTRQDGWSGYSITRSDTTTSSFGLRSGVGVVVYF